jgi:hypothetical protein
MSNPTSTQPTCPTCGNQITTARVAGREYIQRHHTATNGRQVCKGTGTAI